MTATMWISGRTCRVIVKDHEGSVIDMNDDWNNRASAESWAYEHYPAARQRFVSASRELDEEWRRCKDGSG